MSEVTLFTFSWLMLTRALARFRITLSARP